ncbi:MAG: cytochrome P450 [Proteobacteria bacterium]|nr:cytochrome P450 [Pseudomonadota bacterium]
MVAPASTHRFAPRRQVQLTSADFCEHKYAWYRWMLEEAPVCAGRISVLRVSLVSRYGDCRAVLTDERFVRNRGRAKGRPNAGPAPFPLPKSVAAVATGMIVQDDPEHRRLRNLVNKAFTHRAVERLSHRVEELSRELLDGLAAQGSVDLLAAYSRPIPTRVIGEMMGVAREDVHHFERSIGVLTRGLSGVSILRSLFWDLPRTAAFVRALIDRKRASPGDDILSALIQAEEEGDRLSKDELVAMVFLLVVAGFETTLHLITNGVHTLLEHPDQLDRLRTQPDLWDSAVEEIVRHRGPIHTTKPQYATEDVTLHGYTIARGTPVLPMLGAANHDPRAFEKPDVFDVARSPNHHLGFGFGNHFCLGRQLALMETRIALKNLFERYPDLHLAIEPGRLELARIPGWHRYQSLPVALR